MATKCVWSHMVLALGIFGALLGYSGRYLIHSVFFYGDPGRARLVSPPTFRAPEWLLGPVIGRVDDSSARVLVELLRPVHSVSIAMRNAHATNCLAEVGSRAFDSIQQRRPEGPVDHFRRTRPGASSGRAEGGGLSGTSALFGVSLVTKRPSDFPFGQDLRPNTAYSVEVAMVSPIGLSGAAAPARGFLRTLPRGGWQWTKSTPPVGIAVLSCNHIWWTVNRVPAKVGGRRLLGDHFALRSDGPVDLAVGGGPRRTR
jgi:hypothetical protein